MPRSTPAARPPLPLPSRPALWAALLLGLAGLVVALVLVRLHGQAHAGISSFCAVSETVNCDKVAISPYSVVLRLPVALWGAIGYAAMITLAAWALFGPRPHPRWPVGLLWLLALAAVAGAVALAYVSKVLIGAWCLLCAGSWTISAALLAAAWVATRPAGPLAAVAADLAAVRAAPRRSAAAAVLSFGGLAALAALFPAYWNRPPPAPAPAAAVTPIAPPTYQGPVVVTSFSDYECPYCARAHAEVRELLKRRPDITLLKRHFPLDQACNPLLKRPMHEKACQYARAAICAEAQGQLDPMDDALFENQRAKEDVEVLAGRLGLDLAIFRACLRSQATEDRLRGDIATALQAGTKATPTYLVRGRAYSGEFPWAQLPPPPAVPATPPAGQAPATTPAGSPPATTPATAPAATLPPAPRP